ncbi:helix-turn-helix domain-containing protein [Dysosmobacter welbionis]|uniref:helix-turn-helix domain-containing protein n=1 Tax=Dysosmobacter welbionis TaxID=2093857 RepID=UPI003A8DF0EB
MSQEQLAYKLQIIGLDVTQKAISRIENGSRVVADYGLDYLATALGTTINHLLGKE